MGVAILFLAETLMKFILLRHKCIHEVGVAIIAFATVYTAVSKVLATANENGSQNQITFMLRMVIGYLLRIMF